MNIIPRLNFKYGIVDTIEPRSIPPGAASRSLGFLTKGDHIEITRGRHLLGTEVEGAGRVSGISVGQLPDNTQTLFKTRGKKIEYYDTVTSDWIEIGSDTLGSSVVTTDDPYGEDVTFSPYTNLAGAQIWACSPNSSLFKIMVANPATAKDMYDSSKNFKGYIRIKSNSMYLWNRSGTAVKDPTGLYRSKLDKDEVGDYTQVTGEAYGTGDGATKTFAATAAAISAKRTIFGAQITDGVETFSDDKHGNLIGTLGGTGTINYGTGAASVTFNTAPVNLGAITWSYYWEDASIAGIADFTKATPRVAGEGFVIRQDDVGGIFMFPAFYNGVVYCLHRLATWALSISSTDDAASNPLYRDKVGIPNHRAAVETGKGVYYIDDVDQTQPRLRLLTLDSNLSQVVPVPISNNLDLSDYRFDKAVGVEWGDYVLFACRTSGSEINNRVIAFNKLWESLDVLPYFVSCFAILNGVLIAGDSGSSNAYELFSGFDDDDSILEAYWESGDDRLEMEGLKKPKNILLEGNIALEQAYRAYTSVDNGAYVEIGLGDVSDDWADGEPAIWGRGAYVDRSQRVDIGPETLGRGELGGGSDGVEAYHYERLIPLRLDRFEVVRLKIVPQLIGYISLSTVKWWDVRHKANKPPAKYRV